MRRPRLWYRGTSDSHALARTKWLGRLPSCSRQEGKTSSFRNNERDKLIRSWEWHNQARLSHVSRVWLYDPGRERSTAIKREKGWRCNCETILRCYNKRR